MRVQVKVASGQTLPPLLFPALPQVRQETMAAKMLTMPLRMALRMLAMPLTTAMMQLPIVRKTDWIYFGRKRSLASASEGVVGEGKGKGKGRDDVMTR
jgi:hypothetical protein